MIKVEELKVEIWNDAVMKPLCNSCSDGIATHKVGATNKYDTTFAIQLCEPCLKELAVRTVNKLVAEELEVMKTTKEGIA